MPAHTVHCRVLLSSHARSAIRCTQQQKCCSAWQLRPLLTVLRVVPPVVVNMAGGLTCADSTCAARYDKQRLESAVQTLVPGGDEAVPEPMDIEDMTSVGRNSQVWHRCCQPQGAGCMVHQLCQCCVVRQLLVHALRRALKPR